MDNVGDRVEWNCPFDFGQHGLTEPVISTMPMSVLAKIVSAQNAPPFENSPIIVARSRVEADVFQTIYFTDPSTPVYRASITKDLLIVEAMREISDDNMQDVLDAFGIIQHTPIDSNAQKFGKIAPIDDVWRRNFIFRMSAEYNIYSVGRFAIWKNILLDDVVQDLSVVKRLINLGGVYYNHLNK